MIRKLAFVIIVSLCCFQVIAQELQFSQYFTSSLYLNPAFSAIYVDPSISINFRKPADNGLTYNETNQISATLPILVNQSDNTSRAGLGLMAYSNKSGFEGVFQITGALASYAHNISLGSLNTEVIAIGIQGGFESYKVNFGKLRWGTGYNPFYGYDDSRPTPVTEFDQATMHPIINAGIMYYYNRERNFTIYNYSAFSGFAVTNLNRPDKTFVKTGDARAPMLFKYHGGIEVKFKKFNFLPNILAQYQSGNLSSDAGLYMWYSFRQDGFGSGTNIKLVAGSWYRLRDSFIFLTGLNYNSMSFKVSYDLNSNLFYDNEIEFSRNHVELSIQYYISKDSRVRKISNPLF